MPQPAASGIDQGRSNNGKRAAFFYVAGSSEKASRALESVCIDTAGENFARRRSHRVVSASQASDRVEKDNYVTLMLNETLGFLKDHFCNLNVPLRRLVKC